MLKNALMKTASRLTSFRRQEDGAVAVWWTILMIPLLGFTFGAIKYTELSEQRTNMIDAMDASALAMARWIKLNDKEPCEVATGTSSEHVEDREAVQRYAREYFVKNYPQHRVLFADRALTTPFDPIKHLRFDMTCSTIVATADTFSDMGGILAEYFNVGAVPLDVSSEITLPGSGKVEISVVVDVSGSMGTQDMQRFRRAMGAMADELFGEEPTAENENVRIGVVPFNSIVNPGPALAAKNNDWFDEAAQAPFHGANFIDFRPQLGPTEQNQLLTASRRVNHFDLFRSVPDVDWAGCVEARPFPLDEVPDAPGTSMNSSRYTEATTLSSDFEQQPSANADVRTRMNEAWSEIPSMDFAHKSSLNDADASRYVPWFYPDEADCEEMGSSGSEERRRCRHNNDNNKPSWMGNFGNPKSLFDGPSHQSYDGKYRNRYFIRDAQYIAWKNAPEAQAKPYHRFVLEHRNAVNDAGGGRENFFDPLQNDYADFREAMRRLGMNTPPGKALGGNQEYKMRQGYVGLWDETTKTYKGKYDLYDPVKAWDDHVDEKRTHGPNFRCGAPLLPLTSKRQTLMDYVNSLSPGGGTNSAMGMAWGWNMLTPSEPLSYAVDLSDPAVKKQWRKFVILMSDGKNNVNAQDTHMLTDRMAYGYGYEDRLNIVSESDPDPDDITTAYDREMDNKTIRICNRMEAEGIKVFAVGYGLDQVTSSSKRDDIETMLKACANSADGTDIIGLDGNPTGVTYVRADNEAALKKAFRDITDAIEDLHISG